MTSRARRLASMALLIGSSACARSATPPMVDPIFEVSVYASDRAGGTLTLEIENRSNRPLHIPDPDRWNFANLIKVGFRAYQSVIPTEAPGAVSDRPPDRDGDMAEVHWVLPLEDARDIAARSRERRTIRVPETLGAGRYSLALVVTGRAQERWLTIEEPVLGPRTANLPGSVRGLAFVVFGCLLLGAGALISIALPGNRGATR
jgi:hypothetical protein